MSYNYTIIFYVDDVEVGRMTIPWGLWQSPDWQRELVSRIEVAHVKATGEVKEAMRQYWSRILKGESGAAEGLPDVKGLYYRAWADKFGATGLTSEEIGAKEKPRRFVMRDVAAVEEKLWPIPEDVALWNTDEGYNEPKDGIMWARPELIFALRRWQDNLWAKCQEVFNGGKGRKLKKEENIKTGQAAIGVIKINSPYRRLGKPATGDSKGTLDSQDEYGHWSGYAVDVGRTETGKTFDPPLNKNEVHKAGVGAGFCRPHEDTYGETWHYRPKVEYIYPE